MNPESEIRMNEVLMTGRISQGPVKTEDGLVHFMFDCSRSSEPFHCVCNGKTAENALTYLSQGDELGTEGELYWMDFPNTGKTLVIYIRNPSFGRKFEGLG